MTNVLPRRKYASGRRAIAISDRSGLPFKYTEMVEEPGTLLWVHYSESDGIWNVADYSELLNIPAGDAEDLMRPSDYVVPDEVDQWEWYVDEGAL